MQVASLATTSSQESLDVSANENVADQRACWWETTYTTVNWDYPPSAASYRDALLCRGASRSRFLRIAYSSTREGSRMSASCCSLSSAPTTQSSLSVTSSSSSISTSTFPTLTMSVTCPSNKRAVSCLPSPPPPLRHSYVYFRPPSSTPVLRSLKRRKPLWPKPPHYHASLLRSPVSRRKGLFRTVLPPSKAVDFFRWDIILGGVSLSTRSQGRDNRSIDDMNMNGGSSLHVAESVLVPYEAAAGFFGWHGLGLDVIRRGDGNNDGSYDDDECYWGQGSEERTPDHEDDESAGVGTGNISPLQVEIDEMDVEEGRARWARMAEELVGPPGLVLPQFEPDTKSPPDPDHKDARDTQPFISMSRDEVRWDPDIGSSGDRPSRPPTTSVERGKSGSDRAAPGPRSSSKPKLRKDSPLPWWYGPPPHRGPPPVANYTSLRFAPPPPQFSPWYPSVRVGPVHGHGYWYGAPPNGTPSNREPPHIFPSPGSIRPGQSSRHHGRADLNQDDCNSGMEGDKETETDHGYESTATTTDSDPPPDTPTGPPTTSHFVGTPQVHGDDDVDVHGIEIDGEFAAAAYRPSGFSDPTTPIKLPGRSQMSFSSTSASPLTSVGSPVSSVDCYQSSNSAVVFPSLNGSFRQGSLSRPPASSSESVSTRSTPARSVTPVNPSSSSPAVELASQLGLSICHANEAGSKMKMKTGSPEPRSPLHSNDTPAVTLSVCSPPPTSPSPGLRKDSQGFWEPVTPISPSSSSSSLPSEGKASSRSSGGWIGENTVQALAVGLESAEAPASSSKTRSLSPGPRHVISAGSTRSSSTSLSSPTSTSASSFGAMHPSSASPPTNPAMLPPNSNPTTLLPAFLANAAVKKKRTSRTREIVDRLRSSSIDAGKGGVGSDGSGWLGGSNGEYDVLGKAPSASETAAGERAGGEQPSPSPPSKSGIDSKNSQMQSQGGSKGSGAASATVSVSEPPISAATQMTATTTNIVPTPFPILSVSKASKPANQSKGTVGLESTSPSHGVDRSRMNGNTATSPSASNTSPQRLPGANATSSIHPPHPSLPSPTYPTVHAPPPLGPPPMIAVAPYAHPVYVPFAQYQPPQGGWLAVYRPPPLPVNPHPVQTHVPPITGASGMRHVSW